MKKKITAIVLAGGNGSRMRSSLPKPLERIGGKTMLDHVLLAIQPLCDKPIVVVGKQGKEIMSSTTLPSRFIFQPIARGTGDAIRCAKNMFISDNSDHIIVVPADHPFIQTQILEQLCSLREQQQTKLAVATVIVEDFSDMRKMFYHCGRVVRNMQHNIQHIKEAREATTDELKIKEVNVSYYCFDPEWLYKTIDTLTNSDMTNELYLTDLIQLGQYEKNGVSSLIIQNSSHGIGVNTPEELDFARNIYTANKTVYAT